MNSSQSLLNLNIIDYSCNNLFKIDIRQLILYLNNSSEMDGALNRNFVHLLTQMMDEKHEKFRKDIHNNTFYKLINHSLYFMILLINIKNKNILNLIFEKDSKLVKILLNIIDNSKQFHKSNKICKIFCNLFFTEYREIFSKYELEELYILNNEKFTSINVENIDIYPKNVYCSILEKIFTLDLSYDFLNNKSICIQDDDKPLCILIIYYYSKNTFYSKYNKNNFFQN